MIYPCAYCGKAFQGNYYDYYCSKECEEKSAKETERIWLKKGAGR
jgi:hypothetical protein